jgi:hypothetical protein
MCGDSALGACLASQPCGSCAQNGSGCIRMVSGRLMETETSNGRARRCTRHQEVRDDKCSGSNSEDVCVLSAKRLSTVRDYPAPLVWNRRHPQPRDPLNTVFELHLAHEMEAPKQRLARAFWVDSTTSVLSLSAFLSPTWRLTGMNTHLCPSPDRRWHSAQTLPRDTPRPPEGHSWNATFSFPRAPPPSRSYCRAATSPSLVLGSSHQASPEW